MIENDAYVNGSPHLSSHTFSIHLVITPLYYYTRQRESPPLACCTANYCSSSLRLLFATSRLSSAISKSSLPRGDSSLFPSLSMSIFTSLFSPPFPSCAPLCFVEVIPFMVSGDLEVVLRCVERREEKKREEEMRWVRSL